MSDQKVPRHDARAGMLEIVITTDGSSGRLRYHLIAVRMVGCCDRERSGKGGIQMFLVGTLYCFVINIHMDLFGCLYCVLMNSRLLSKLFFLRFLCFLMLRRFWHNI